MKVAQNDETNPDTQPIHPPRIPNRANSQLSPSGSPVRKCETPEILSRMFPPFADIAYYCVRSSPSTAYCHVMLCDDLLFIVFPLRYFFPVDPETAADTPVIDYIDDSSSFLPEQPGKPTPLVHPDIAYSFRLLLALE